jgi:phospho-N-acetylmuramoyl-pentapeptide-transferase
MLYWLSQYENSPLRIFKYLTFRSAGAAAISFLIVVLFAPAMIRFLKEFAIAPQRLAGFVSEEELCAIKGKTPAMGGILIIIAVLVSTLLWARLDLMVTRLCLMVMLSFGLLGFWDDFRKVRRMSGPLGKDGVSGKLRLFAEMVIAIAAVFILYRAPDTRDSAPLLTIPFMKEALLYMPMWFAMIYGVFVLWGTGNGVNISDGMDGLATGAMIIAMMSYMLIAYLCGNVAYSEYLSTPYIKGCGEAAVFGAAVVGACMGFLWYNSKPAAMFMGDTGSLALGGSLGIMAIIVKQEMILPIIGGVFVMEAGSSLLQTLYYKATGGKRIFLMAPVHHHFQKKGWSETQIVTRFWIIGAICAAVGLATLKIR